MTTCKSCEKPTTGRSRYCREHRDAAALAWRSMIAAKATKRLDRDARFLTAFDDAVDAGLAAGKAVAPEPMTVVEHSNPLDDTSPPVRAWNVPDGPCGFAWVTIRPGTCSFARWLIRTGRGRTDSYGGGVTIWISSFGQSITRKSACADAMASALRASLSVKAYADSRLD